MTHLHRRLLQRPRPRGRTRRHHPRRQRRGARCVRRADPRRLRAAARLALRRRLEPRPPRRAEHPEDRAAAADPRRGRLPAGADQEGAASEPDAALRTTSSGPLLPWTLSFLRPYRGRVLLLTLLLLVADRARRAAAVAAEDRHRQRARPGQPLPEPVAGWLRRAHRRQHASCCWSSSSSPACCCRCSTRSLSPTATQVQVDTGQRMVYDLRCRLFQHLQALGLHHHITTSTGDSVYRLDVDAYCDREPGDERHLPARDLGADAGGDVRRPAAGSNVTLALLSLAVVPFLYLCLRYYMTTLSWRGGAGQGARVEADRAPLRDLQRDPAGQELRARAARARSASPTPATEDDERAHRDHLAGVAVRAWWSALITIIGTALVLVVGGMHVLRRRADGRRAARGHRLSGARSTGRCRRSRTPPAGCRARSPAPGGSGRCSR